MTKPRRPSCKRWLFAAALLVCVASSLSVGLGVARAGTQRAGWTEVGSYACPTSCATSSTFTFHGVAYSPQLGAMTYTGSGTVLDYDPATNCLDQAETWTFTTLSHAGSFDLETVRDTFCFSSNPNVSYENATYELTGGTGQFAGATGSARSSETVLTSPQVGAGTFKATISY